MTISVVIPTYNRYESLVRTLVSLSAQKELPNEVLVVDSSTAVADETVLKKMFPALHITYIHTQKPSVCAQRNIGIKKASGSHIFLCDDDLEFSNDYILQLKNYFFKNQSVSAASGLFLEKNESGEWAYIYPVKSVSQLCWKFIFQQSIWCDPNDIKFNFFSKPIYKFIYNFYRKRNNTYTLAGWPLLTDFNGPAFKTAFYSLGASIIKKEWLMLSAFDETLDNNGIGDNYGVALNFPEFPAIHVLTGAHAYHHKIAINRLSASESYYKRVLALHYFMANSKQFNRVNKAFLIWSLLGNIPVHLIKGNSHFLKATTKAICRILIGKPNLTNNNKICA